MSLSAWAEEILRDVRAIAELVDTGDGQDVYVGAVDAQMTAISDPESTPSARMIAELKTADSSFFEFAMACAEGHKQYFADLVALSAERKEEFVDEAADSLRRQQEIEAAEVITFEEYLDRWFGDVERIVR